MPMKAAFNTEPSVQYVLCLFVVLKLLKVMNLLLCLESDMDINVLNGILDPENIPLDTKITFLAGIVKKI